MDIDIIQPLLRSPLTLQASYRPFGWLIGRQRDSHGPPTLPTEPASNNRKPARRPCFSLFVRDLNPKRKNQRYPVNATNYRLQSYRKTAQPIGRSDCYSSISKKIFTQVFALKKHALCAVRGKNKIANADTNEFLPSSAQQAINHIRDQRVDVNQACGTHDGISARS